MPLLNRSSNVYSVVFASLFFICACFACQHKANTSHIRTPRITEGVSGIVVLKEGVFKDNGDLGAEGKLMGVPRKILVYKETNMRAVDMAEEDFVTNVYSELIDSLESNEDGYFEKKLMPGNYSLFIIENNRLYAKLNEQGYYFPVHVNVDSVAFLTLEIDYKAIY
jgi:hypothetical protein